MYIMPIIVSNNCEQQFQNSVMCALHDFFSSKVRFMHTNTVTRSHSCSEKNTNTPRAHLVIFNISLPTKVTKFCIQELNETQNILLYSVKSYDMGTIAICLCSKSITYFLFIINTNIV